MPFFSVVIPVYKIEKYIKPCVDSVLNQNFSDFEILLIDDGGQDNCPEICDNLAVTDERITVFHKKNGGLSSARNEGIRLAKGECILFIDGDDLLSCDNVLEKLYDVFQEKNCDVVSFNRKTIIDETEEIFECSDYRECGDSSGNYELFIRNMIIKDCFYGSAWVLCAKTDFLRNNYLYFTEGKTTEDFDWIMRMLNLKPFICNIPDVFYLYRSGRVGSITRTINRKKQEDYLFFLNKFVNYKFYSEEYRDIVLNYVAYQFVIFCAWNQFLTNKDEKQYFIKSEKPLRFLLKYDLMRQTRLAHKCSRLLGYRLTDKLLGLFLRKSLGLS